MAKKREGRPGIYLHRSLYESAAFRSLSAIDIQILLRFLSKRCIGSISGGKRKGVKHINNNGEIEFSFAEAEANGWKRSTFSNSLQRLQQRGFLTCVEPGGLSQGQMKRCTKWRVNVAAEDEPGQPWMKWVNPEANTRPDADERTANLKQFRKMKEKGPPQDPGAALSHNHGDGHPKAMGTESGRSKSSVSRGPGEETAVLSTS